MKTITKKIEIEKKFYIANDGTEFEDEYECVAYDIGLLYKNFETYDADFNRVDLGIAEYLVVHSNEELDDIKEACIFNGWTCEGLIEVGLYKYNGDYGEECWEKIRFPISLKDFIEFI